ncbi:helix-turn-helix domain-containing protein [Listeria booriae]|uniref:helix-turn-helix domain-containing protein n=1 Tax=Listeria booriae TaxID=1552123 RepID=UPI00164E6FAE|nr:helix-turn-helix transcriptional regulator [Listeria booriae]MBC6300333.1 helix-turn-helix transcriptional regulator [Listeria booriae]
MDGLGNRLKELRKSKNMTMEELAHQLAKYTENTVSKSVISRWENDSMEPRGYTLRAYAQVFNVTLDYLLGMEEEQKSENIIETIAAHSKDRDAKLTKEDMDKIMDYVDFIISNKGKEK